MPQFLYDGGFFVNDSSKPVSQTEFVILFAFLTSLVAMTTDLMLPGLDLIGRDLAVSRENDVQLIITLFFFGLAIGQVFAGPLSDIFGRKPVSMFGLILFMMGCVLSTTASSWSVMLIGRFLQGFGAAFPRIVSMAIIRDCYQGRQMARIVSIIMAVFIAVPIVSPAMGELVLHLGHWRHMFAVLFGLSALSGIWFWLRQPETLAKADRRRFSAAQIIYDVRIVLNTRITMGYTVALGCVFGAFIAYISTAQQIFEVAYDSGPLFSVYFAVAAISLGMASLLNARLVVRLGMRKLIWRALCAVVILSATFLIYAFLAAGPAPFIVFMVWLLANFLAIGILFGNLNAIAMEPLGKVAGMAAAIIGSLSTLISVSLAWVIGASFNGTVIPLVVGFLALGMVALAIVYWTERPSDRP